LNTFLN
jgi:serine/threonine-protein phosphatase 5